jgi:3-isopropylmalate/(R)-2-methylmalate dehydratase small subunit
VAGKNFGCGSSREQAAACLKAAGVQAVVAKSFARIYFRNAINLGLAVLQSEEAADRLETGDHVDIELGHGEIRSAKGTFRFLPLPASVIGIIEAGGLIEYTKRKLEQEQE